LTASTRLISIGLVLIGLVPCSFAYPPAILCRQGIDLNGWAMKVDSFASSDPAKSTAGLYDPAKAGEAGDVACEGGITNALPTGNALIYGHLYAGSNSPMILGPNGGIGTHAWLGTNTGIEPGYELNSVHYVFPDTTPPYGGGLAPVPGDVVTAPGVTNHYDHVLYSGDYSATNLAGTTIVLGTARLVLPNELRMGGSDGVTVAQGGNLVLYCGGSNCAIGGNGILNQSGFAGAFVVYCSPGVSNLTLSGNAGFIGVVVAPNADTSVNGGGNNVVDVSGALLVRSLKLNGNFDFHLDESVTAAATLQRSSFSPGNQFQFEVAGFPGFDYAVQASTNLISWESVATNISPFTFVETVASRLSRRFYRVFYSP
jgi:hypothetical protein